MDVLLILLLGLALVLAVIACGRFTFAAVVSAFVVAGVVVHELKRLVFLFGPQTRLSYYLVQILPDLVLVPLLMLTALRLARGRVPASARALAVFLAFAVAVTLLSLAKVSMTGRLLAVHQTVLPAALFFVGLALEPAEVRLVAKTFVCLAAVALAGAFYHILIGPTAADIAWARGANGYSVQALTTLVQISGTEVTSLFRPFSILPDPLTFGLFMIVALAVVAAAQGVGAMGTKVFAAMLAIAAVGTLICLVRTTMLSLLAMVALYPLLRGRLFRNPLTVLGIALGSSVAVIEGAKYLLSNFAGVFYTADPFLARLVTVGTLVERISAFELLRQLSVERLLIGTGYGFQSAFTGEFTDAYNPALLKSHNFLFEMILNLGVPGFLLFCLFYFFWLRELARAAAVRHPMARSGACWMIAFSFSLMIAGYTAGSPMSVFSYLALGIGAGMARAWARTEEEAPPAYAETAADFAMPHKPYRPLP